MSLFAISDLHLSLGCNKPMDVFSGWDNYIERLKSNWNSVVKADDFVVMPGDLSWAMKLQDAKDDFMFVNELNGIKIISKGNHDYWWTTLKKMNDFLTENNIDTIKFLHTNHYKYKDFGICGARGWINENGCPSDIKILARESIRLELSIQSALNEGLNPIVFLHYPPIYANDYNENIIQVLHKYNIKECYYGHIHGKSCNYSINGIRDGIKYSLISSDFIQFCPVNIK